MWQAELFSDVVGPAEEEIGDNSYGGREVRMEPVKEKWVVKVTPGLVLGHATFP